MKTILESYKRREYEVELNFYHGFAGYGQYTIFCQVDYLGNIKTLKTHSTNSMLIDEIQDAKMDGESDYHIKLLYYANFFDNAMKEIILEWIESINDN